MFVFTVIILTHVFLLWFIHRVQQHLKYSTACCKDVRASLGMWAYPSNVDAKRAYLNNPNCKF